MRGLEPVSGNTRIGTQGRSCVDRAAQNSQPSSGCASHLTGARAAYWGSPNHTARLWFGVVPLEGPGVLLRLLLLPGWSGSRLARLSRPSGDSELLFLELFDQELHGLQVQLAE
jgi:hypothetical protein